MTALEKLHQACEEYDEATALDLCDGQAMDTLVCAAGIANLAKSVSPGDAITILSAVICSLCKTVKAAN